MKTRLWLCGQIRMRDGMPQRWEFQGVFSTESKAERACRNANYFIFPFTLDDERSDRTTIPHGTRYPLRDRGSQLAPNEDATKENECAHKCGETVGPTVRCGGCSCGHEHAKECVHRCAESDVEDQR